MKNWVACALCASWSVAGAATVDQGELIDVPTGAGDSAGFGINSEFDRLQTFTVGLDGQFVGLRLQLAGAFGDATLPVSIVEITGRSTVGATLGTADLQTSDVSDAATSRMPQTIELAFASFAVQSGDSLGILLDGPNVGDYRFSFALQAGGVFASYDGGELFFSRGQSAYDIAVGDLPFETLVDVGDDPEVIPLPPAAPALLAGLGALALLRRRQRSAS